MTERNDAENVEVDGENYVSFGYLDPLLGKRIMDRLSLNHVRFIGRDASRLGASSTGIIDHVSWPDASQVLARINRIELFIHLGDQESARKLIHET